ncbi:MAG: hypothetical protein LBE84_03725, partial [Planctomycetota bacterium]|nr:hypothetical protein [Planctomycetota bacterium]
MSGMDNAGGQATGNNGAGKDSPNAGKAAPGSTVSLRRDSAAFGPLGHEDMANAVMAYLSASRMVRDGNAALEDDKQRHLRSIQNRYWRIFFSTLSSILANRQDEFEFTDEERLFLDIGLVDIRMISDGSNPRAAKAILDRVGEKGPAGCFHLSEWLSERYRQARIDGVPIPIDAETMSSDASSRLEETRRRVLARLGPLLTGLPGIPLEVSEAMRSGNLERNLLSINIAALENPRRKTLLHRHKLWKLRNQVLEKARARASGQEAVRLMELLDEIYAREWRERYDRFLHGAPPADRGKTPGAGNDEAAPKSNTDAVLDEARQIRMRMALMDAIEGKQSPDMA